jgi:integration host factor subunit beta
MVTKSILAKKLKTTLTNRAAFLCIDTLLESMADALSRGERIELRGFGSFYVSKQAPRKTSINGGMAVPEHGRIVFRPVEKLRQSVLKLPTGGK